jgi:hypothetical protein
LSEEDQLKLALNQQKNSKPPGVDNIPPDTLKGDRNNNRDCKCTFFKKYGELGKYQIIGRLYNKNA